MRNRRWLSLPCDRPQPGEELLDLDPGGLASTGQMVGGAPQKHQKVPKEGLSRCSSALKRPSTAPHQRPRRAPQKGLSRSSSALKRPATGHWTAPLQPSRTPSSQASAHIRIGQRFSPSTVGSLMVPKALSDLPSQGPKSEMMPFTRGDKVSEAMLSCYKS